jgi:hypothetical protein
LDPYRGIRWHLNNHKTKHFLTEIVLGVQYVIMVQTVKVEPAALVSSGELGVNKDGTVMKIDAPLTRPRSAKVLRKMLATQLAIYGQASVYYRPALEPIIRQTLRDYEAAQ